MIVNQFGKTRILVLHELQPTTAVVSAKQDDRLTKFVQHVIGNDDDSGMVYYKTSESGF